MCSRRFHQSSIMTICVRHWSSSIPGTRLFENPRASSIGGHRSRHHTNTNTNTNTILEAREGTSNCRLLECIRSSVLTLPFVSCPQTSVGVCTSERSRSSRGPPGGGWELPSDGDRPPLGRWEHGRSRRALAHKNTTSSAAILLPRRWSLTTSGDGRSIPSHRVRAGTHRHLTVRHAAAPRVPPARLLSRAPTRSPAAAASLASMTIGCDMRTPKRRRRATQKDAAGAALVARAVEVGSGPRRPRRVRHDLAQARNKSARDQHSPFAEHHRRKKRKQRKTKPEERRHVEGYAHGLAHL